MEYRKLPHGEEQISVIGLGNSSRTSQVGEKEIQATVEMALESGVNYFDMAAGDAAPFAAYGKALAGCREKASLQVHFGADYHTGKYGWTQDLEEIKRSISWQLEALQTDYIDFGFIHCVDELADLEKAVSGGALDYIQSLKKQGVVRHVGLSSHTPAVVQKALDLGILDMVMFSINPGYDYQQGEYAIGQVDERQALYRRCQAEGVGISVMKAFSGGQLLKAETSPFRQALTEYQCIQSILGTFAPQDANGVCVYCNHCQPCPMGLDVGLINKYYDLSKAGDILARDHYNNLEKTAGDCVSCGHCDSRCPFHVAQSQRMEEIREYFGK